ncbi:MAG: hypothetical protein H0X31_00110 [Nostocaceae cyanobacterium]|nr:hypothetical protein [Nostocaceae cyanobacterium]
MATRWETRGEKLVEDLQNVDTVAIEALANTVVQEIIDAYPNSINSRKKPLKEVRKAVESAFPHSATQASDNQYFTDSGIGKVGRYQHLALKYLTFRREDWNAIGDDARKEYIEETSKVLPVIKPTLPTIKDMNIEQLELDIETQQIVLDAIAQSNLSLAEFIQQACKVYAKTVTGKSRKYADDDLTGVLTAELLDANNKEYKTHPKKIEELTRRAIAAITKYNNEIATEQYQKWFISGTTINALTGSRVQSVNEILKSYRENIDTHHSKHVLTAYTNRGNGRKIEDEIDLVAMVPDGMDL